ACPSTPLPPSPLAAPPPHRRHQAGPPLPGAPPTSIFAQRVAHINRPIRHYSPANVGSCSTGLATSELRRMFLQPSFDALDATPGCCHKAKRLLSAVT